MTTARYGAMAAPLPNGEVLITGGVNGSYLSSAELFNPATNAFSSAGVGSMTTACECAVAMPLPNGEELIAGGHDNGSILSSAKLFESAPHAAAAGGDFGYETPGEPSVAEPLTPPVSCSRPRASSAWS